MVAELSFVLILLCVVVVPVAAIAFARSGKAYEEIGKGRFAVDFDDSSETDHHEELRQLVEAKAYRQARRGEQPVDVEREVERLSKGEPEETADAAPPPDPATAGIRAEIREVVIAKNESRERRGEEPLDVESEVERMLAEFG
ncbi:MAG TPA: hypothetical protein PKA56_01155 [Solirubrobacterales bacterium]|jgi:hypothetical protein|nr:hypothetical protein [Solirubrobacterales bacterium]HMU26311.1 hypothetical protein [Solirubrobacterales bacterium]HMW44839.1 hypothetical protein [Solirubrobacterales bacterium]HMX70343.1 hypothetical protein [Solirubrobacterales bacterium]HMY24765.1 hypothetical protein [Solirubrobacterales bacterium]